MKSFLNHLRIISAIIGLLIGAEVSARADGIIYYLSACSYSVAEGGSITFTIGIARQSSSFDISYQNAQASGAQTSLNFAGNGTFPIVTSGTGADVANNGFYTVNIPSTAFGAIGGSYNYTVNFIDNTNLQYDRTGTVSVSSPYTSANCQSGPITILDNDSHVGVLFSSTTVLEGGVSGVNQTTIRFVRDVAVTQARTVNYSVSGTAIAGTDYTPSSFGTITIPQGTNEVDVTVSANNSSQTVNKTLTVSITSSPNYQIWSLYPNSTATILADHPNIGVYANSPTMTRNESTSSFTFYEDSYYPSYSQARTVNYTVGGTAANGVDFTPSLSGSIVIPAGVGSVTTSTLTPGTNLTGTKILTATITSGNYGILSSANPASIGILEDEPMINVTASGQYAYQNSQAGQFALTRSGELNKPITVNYTINGTATSGVNYTALPASVTFAANQTSTNLSVAVTSSPTLTNAATVVLTLNSSTNYFNGVNAQAVVTLLPNSDTTNSVPLPVGRYWRGSGSDPTYWSQVVPLESETGTPYSNLYGNAYTLYGIGAWGNTYYHYNATNSLAQTNNANRIAFNNPIVAFGERVGGTPLYLNQSYSFGVYAGDPLPLSAPIQIIVFNRTNLAVAGYILLYPPNVGNTTSWNNYSTNGFQVLTGTNYLANGTTGTTNTYGLTTILSDSPNLSWGTTSKGAYMLTHTASAQATNYYYEVEAFGNLDAKGAPMVQDGSNQTQPSELYTLEFEQRPAWRSVFLDQPHFDGSPLPPFYAGKTLAEMLTNTPPVTNAVIFTPSAATNVDDSPELRRHPTLDNFVASMGNDPIALANYVINSIDLTDPIDYSDNGNVAEQSINPSGVTRGALGTFMEKQGSPVDQCALLVYLLRQAGVPAVYEFPPRNGMKILDARLSRMLKYQVHGGYTEAGQLYTTNTMIPVNYPWVAAYIGTNWVHIFPWLKDYQIVEGFNLYDEMPTNYTSAYPWVKDYIYGKTNLLSLAVDNDNTPRVIFPAFLKQTLLKNHPGISVGDIGVDVFNRQHYYSRWQDFPTPTWVTNVSTPLESLTSSAITNISPTLTNIFDTVSVEIYSLTDPTKDIQTGDMRLVDLHDREFYIYQTATNSTQVKLSLILLPFRTNITSQFSFTNDSALTSKEVSSMTLDQYDDQLGVRFKYYRHRALSAAYAIDPNLAFLGLNAGRQVLLERPLRKGDQAAICMSYGTVTRDMLNVHATDLWQMENALRANPSLTNSISPDVYEGATMYLAGMSYYEKVAEFDQLNQHLHKINNLSFFAAGLSKIGPARDSSGNLTNNLVYPVLPNVDMFFYEVASVGNGTLRPDSGQNDDLADQNYNLIAIIDGSAEEHQVVNTYYQQTNAVSTVRLLQLAQNGGAGIVPLNNNNYLSQATTSYQGKQLQSWDSNIWSQVTAAFQNSSDSNYCTAYITPGPMTNSAYKGMAALILGWSKWQALISPQSLNGAYGQPFPLLSTISPANTINYNLNNNDSFNITLNQPANGSLFAPITTPNFNYLNNYNSIQNNSYSVSYYDSTWNSSVNTVYNLPSTGTQNQNLASAFQTSEQSGFLGNVGGMISQAFTAVADPVHPITGEFYIDETDLQLPGPIPLALRRNYSSENLADNQFGAGWKFSIMPYLSVTAGSTNIYAADMDGAVLAYVQTSTNANVWLPTLAANPQINNNTTAGAGGLVNRLRDRIVLTGTTNYTLYAADGSVRTFQTMTFNNGILNQTRPYLQRWTDSRGNYFTFSFGTDPTQPSFGEVTRIQCSNGNYLGFDYDIYGHIIDAYTGDGRRLLYAYDQYQDLVTVTLPDATTRSYVYQHASQAVTNGSAFYSTHLIVEEDKPDGRTLINAYDANRRVTNQLSTAGVDLTPIRTATFSFANNFNITNSYTNTISGYTLIIDGNGNTNRYDYTNSLITKVTDPLGQTVQQTWYADNATAPGYPRSVATRTDKRGMAMQFLYDGSGNITNTVTTGDITGDGISTQTATNNAIYNSNNLPVQVADAAGNGMTYVYDPVFTFMPQQTIRIAGGVTVSTNFMFYGDATNVIINGNTTQTNIAFGVLTRQVRAYGSSDAATNDTVYDGHGFPSQSIRYTGTGDPNVINNYFYNERGNQEVAADVLGAYSFSDYDAMNRPIEQENYDEFGNPLSWSFNYYNDNGEISWIDGPRYNPEDYIFFDHDGMGNVSTEIHWRSQAKSDGTGVQAASGYNLYAQTFYQRDPLGNITLTVDPRGAETTNIWNSVCELVQSKHLDIDGVTVLSTEGFAYEAGGLVHYYTNGLGGVTAKTYTITGKPKFQSNPDGSTNAWRYYLDGRTKREIQSNGAYWQSTYDDVNLITTRIFYSASGTPLATNSFQIDRRGNVIRKTDAAGISFTTTFDGIDRPKITAGPAIVTVQAQENPFTQTTTYVTNTLQQINTNFYDAAGRSVTNINVLNEKTVANSDAIGRPTSTLIYSPSGSVVRESYIGYSADHNSITTTNGSGANAIVNTIYTDTEGHNVLSIAYPAAGYLDYTWQDYDLSGNLDYEEHDSSASGSISGWTYASFTHDGLNRTTSKVDRDGAPTTYAFDPLSDVTNRTMPGGLQWRGSFNNAGQMLQELIAGGGNTTRTNSYVYFSIGSPFAGLLQTKTDGRGTACGYLYDDWLRPTNAAYTGLLPEQNLTTSWQFEPRGFITSVTEQFANTNTGPKTTVQRVFYPYGLLSTESVNDGSFSYGTKQHFDGAGRRSTLSIGNANYGFGWRADNALISATGVSGSGGYNFDTAGLLTNRIVGNRTTSIISRDGEGKPFTVLNYVNGVNVLSESLSWFLDGTLATHTVYRPDFTDSRIYSYASLSRRLVQEQQNLDGSTIWTNNLSYDNGVSAGAGVLTQVGQGNSASNSWNGAADPFSRVSTETNHISQYAAYGHVNGQASLSAWLDNQPVTITATGTNALQWRANVELSSGAHQLKVAALHPSGFFTAWATNSFTNNLAYQTTADSFDDAGNVTQRVWTNPNGTTNRIQALSWDARGRLHKVSERDASNSGYDWTAVYDGLNRRLQTTAVAISNGVALVGAPVTINSYYDPQVEFLELGVSYGLTTEWKLYGPDLNGRYGGLNGTGGFDAVSPGLSLFNPTVSDIRGNVLAYYDSAQGSVTWNAARPTGYGAVQGYRPLALANGANVAQSSAWRGRWVDITGYYNIGMRPYNPVPGSWLTYDSFWNESDPNYYTFAGGEPIMGFDPDGRFTKGAYQGTLGIAEGAGTLLWDVGGTIGYGATSIFSQNAANDIYGSQFQGLKNVGTGVGNLVWDTGGTIGYGVTSIFSQDTANDIYGSQLQGLQNIGISMSGGANQSAAYRAGYVAPAVASFFFGGEAADAGEIGDVGNGVKAAEAGSQASVETSIATDQSGQIIQSVPKASVDGEQIIQGGNAALPQAGSATQAAPITDSSKLLPAPTVSNPWMPGTTPVSMPAPANTFIDIAMAPGQIQPGGWGTLEQITDIDFARNNLAVTPAFKPVISQVQRFQVPEGVQIQSGIAGPQTFNGVTYPGGASQIQILNFSDRSKLIPVGAPRPIQ